MATTKYKKNHRGEYATKIWDGTYNPDGSKHRAYLVSKKSSADLEKKVSLFRQKVENQETVFSNITFGEYAEQWLNLSKASKEKNTQKMYRTSVYNYLSFLRDLPMSSIRHSHFQRAINENMSHPRTCKDIKSTFSQIIRSAVRDHILPRSALDELLTDISLPKYIKPPKRPLTALEREAFEKVSLDKRKLAFVSILYYLGTRKEEALALRPQDFDWKNKTVHISNVVIFDGNTPEIKPYPKSERGIRTLPIPKAMVPRVKPFVYNNPDRYLFHTENGMLMTDTGYRRMWESIITAMNIAVGYNPNAKFNKKEKPIQDLTAHIFRHNYCTELCYQIPTISTKMIAKLLGDDERMVLNVYSHIIAEKEDISGAVNNAFKS